jgi:hypothetical protein
MRMMQKNFAGTRFLMGAIAIVMLAATGCTPHAPTSATSVTLNLGAWRAAQISTLAFTPTPANLQRLMLNISGADFATQLQVWNRPDNDTSVVPPMSFTATVPQGSNRLIQVLAIFVDPSTGSMYFYYGDQLATLSGSSSDVSVTLASVGGSASGQGLIGGRYINADQSSGPTGLVNMIYAPPGKPTMTVSTAEIFNGWFTFTVLQGGSFSYVLQNGPQSGLALFQNINATTPGLGSTTNTQNWMNLYIPPYYNDNGSGTRQLQANQYWNVGFFGPGAVATEKVCYLNSNTTFTNLYMAATGSTDWPWYGSSIPTHDDSPSSEAGVMFGGQGIPSLTTGCGETLFSDYFVLNSGSLNQDSALGFRGPFVPVSSQTYLQTSLSGGNVSLTWNYMPGMAAAIDGVVIYARIATVTESQNDYKTDGGFSCASMPADFTASNLVPTSTTTATLTPGNFGANVTTAQLAAAYSAQTAEIVLCPFSAATNTFYSSGLDNQNNNGSGSGSGPATQIVAQNLFGVTGTSAPVSVEQMTCYPITLVAETASGVPGYVTSPLALTLATSDPSNETLYSDAGCAEPLMGGTITGFMGSQTVYLLLSTGAATGSTHSLTINSSGTGWTASPTRLSYSILAQAAAPTQTAVVAPSSVYKYQCFPISLALEDGLGQLTGAGGEGTGGMNTPSGLTYYNNDPSCNPSNSMSLSQVGLLSFSLTASTSPLYAKYTGGAATLTITASPYPITTAASPTTIAVNTPGAPASANLSMMNNFAALSCVPVTVTLNDSQGHATTSPSPMTLSLTASAGAFYSESTCPYQNSTHMVNIEASALSTQIYYMTSTPGSPSLGANATDITSTSGTLTVTPAAMNAFSIYNVAAGPVGSCTPLLIQAGAASALGLPVTTIATGSEIDFSFAASNNTYYTDATCGTPMPSSSIMPNQSQTIVYAKIGPYSPGENAPSGVRTTSGSLYSGAQVSALIVNSSTVGSANEVSIMGPSSFHAGYCQGFAAVLLDLNDDAATPAGSPTTVTLLVTGAGGTVYSDSLCTQTNPISITPSTQDAAMFYIKGMNPGVIGIQATVPGLPQSTTTTGSQINP